MPNSYESTIIDYRQGVESTNWNNIHNPAINLEIN